MINNFKNVLKHRESKVLITNFISLSFINGVNFVIPLLVLPYIIDTVGVSNYGRYAFIYSIVFYFFYISQYGFGLSAVRDIAQAKGDRKAVNEIFNRVMHTKLFVFVLCTASLLVISLTFDLVRDDLFLLYTTYLIVLGDVLNPSWLYQGMEKMKFMTVVSVVSKLTYVVLVFLFIHSESDYVYIGLLQASGFIISGVISYVMAMRVFELTLARVPFSGVIQQLKGSFSSFVTLVAPMLYVNTSTFLLGVFSTTTQVAYFDSAYKISNGFVSLNQILTKVLYPFANRKANKFMLVSSILIVSGCLMSLTCFLFSEWIVSFLFGPEMFESAFVLKILSLTPLLLAIRSAFGINFLLVHKKDKLYMKIAVTSSVIAFVVGLFIINEYRSIGAAIVVILAQGIYSLSSMYFAMKLLSRQSRLALGQAVNH